MTTPHRVGQVAKAELLIADRLEAWGLTEPNERAAWLVQQLQTELGWTPPKDFTDPPPAPSYSTKAGRAAARALFEETRRSRASTDELSPSSTH